MHRHKPQPAGDKPFRPALGALFTAWAVAVPGGAALAAEPPADKALAETVQKLLDRVQQLELRNQELERRVQVLSGATPATGTAAAPSTDTSRAAAMRPEPDDETAEGGLEVEGSVVAVAQQVNAGGAANGRRQGRIGYRGDLVFTLPVGEIGSAQGQAVGQLRFGQGGGVAVRPTYTGAVNSTAFEAAGGSAQTHAVVAQAYYQLTMPLQDGGFSRQPGSSVDLTVGKLDLFGFFDQNALAGDEASQFLNNVFVHNPLLDSGGDIGADEYGFAPGIRIGYSGSRDQLGWGASLGVFASGAAASFNGSPGRPLVIAQVELSPRERDGEARGNYRFYAWTNGRTTDLGGAEQRHSGFGLSVDQRFGRDWQLFGRYGRRTAGDGRFDDALTLGFEFGGRAWGRSLDAIGVAAGAMKTGSAWRTATADRSLVGYAASGQERIAELYYRFSLNDHLHLTPDFQLIQRAGGNGQAPAVRVLGLRANLGF